MRILMLSQFYPPLVGGEERYVRDLSIELAGRGHAVTVATLRQPGLAERQLDRNVTVCRLQGTLQRAEWLFSETSHRHVPPFPDPELVDGLRRLVEQIRPQIVHAHNWLVASFLPLKTWSGARLVVTLHDCSLVCPKKSFMYAGGPCSGPRLSKCIRCAVDHYGPVKGMPTTLATWWMRSAERRLVDRFLPVSQAVAVANRLSHDRFAFEVIPNFIPDSVEPATEEAVDAYTEQLPGEEFLLFVGAGRFKGVDVALRAYAELEDPPPLVMIGPQPPTDVPVPRGVTFFQRWPHAAVMAAWQRSLVGLAPSTCVDACPTVLIEAMSAGRAVVASRIGGAPDLVVDGQTGLLVPAGDSRAVRDALQHLLANPRLRQRMGCAARERARHFQASAIVPRIERVYRELVAA